MTRGDDAASAPGRASSAPSLPSPWSLRRLRFGLPLLVKDLTELAARRRTYIVRSVYAVLLFLAFAIFFASEVADRDLEYGRGLEYGLLGAGRDMLEFLIIVQLVGVYVFLPAMVAPCIAAEKERGTLGLLLVTDLGPWEVLLQKLVGRLVPMLTLVLLSLPVMAVAYAFGGFASSRLLLAAYVIFTTCMQIGAWALMWSAFSWRPSQATIGAYVGAAALAASVVVATVVVEVCMYPLGPNVKQLLLVPITSVFPATLLIGSPFFGGGLPVGAEVLPWILTAAFLVLARVFLVRRGFPRTRRPKSLYARAQDLFRFLVSLRKGVRGRKARKAAGDLPAGRPVLWREFASSSLRTPGGFAFAAGLFGLVLVGAALLLACWMGLHSPDRGFGASLVIWGVWLVAAIVITVKAASAFALERANDTLDLLLVTPLSGREIVAEKAAAVGRRARFVLVLLGALFALEAILETNRSGFGGWGFYRNWRGSELDFGRFDYLFVSLLCVAIYLWTAGWFGMWIGLRLRKQSQATAIALGAVFGMCVVPLVLPPIFMALTGAYMYGWDGWLFALSPATIVVLTEFADSGNPFRDVFGTHAAFPILLNFSVCAGVALVFRSLCLRNADRYLGRPAPSGEEAGARLAEERRARRLACAFPAGLAMAGGIVGGIVVFMPPDYVLLWWRDGRAPAISLAIACGWGLALGIVLAGLGAIRARWVLPVAAAAGILGVGVSALRRALALVAPGPFIAGEIVGALCGGIAGAVAPGATRGPGEAGGGVARAWKAILGATAGALAAGFAAVVFQPFSGRHGAEGHIVAGLLGWLGGHAAGAFLARAFALIERRLAVTPAPAARKWAAISGACAAAVLVVAGVLGRPGVVVLAERHLASIAFSPDGRIAATGSQDGTACLWSVPSGECVATLRGHSACRSVAFSPDGRLVATGGGDETTRLWSVPSAECVATLAGHFHGVSSVAFSPDGRLVATWGGYGTACLWSVPSGECVATLKGHSGYPSVAFSPDGRCLATVSDGSARLWPIPRRFRPRPGDIAACHARVEREREAARRAAEAAYDEAMARARTFKARGEWKEVVAACEAALCAKVGDAEATRCLSEANGFLFDSYPGTLSLDVGGGAMMDLVLIPAGEFVIGSPASEAQRGSSETQHRVRITKLFYMGKYEVTQAQYERIMGTNPSEFKGADLPVEQVSWHDAMEFCRRLSERTGNTVRLPTEAEWEYACRAGTTTPSHYGSSLSSGQANFNGGNPYGGAAKGVSRKKTTGVGSFAANAWGLHDMHGNVYEWCLDWYGEYPSGTARDPEGPAGGDSRVLRGGCYCVEGSCCRSASRHRSDPTSRKSPYGFRVVVAVAGR